MSKLSLRRTLTEPYEAADSRRHHHFLPSLLRNHGGHGIAAALTPVRAVAESAVSPFAVGALGEDGHRQPYQRHPNDRDPELVEQDDDAPVTSRGRSGSIGSTLSRRRSLFGGLRRNRSYSPDLRHTESTPDRSSMDIGRVEERATPSELQEADRPESAASSRSSTPEDGLSSLDAPSTSAKTHRLEGTSFVAPDVQGDVHAESRDRVAEKAKERQDLTSSATEMARDSSEEESITESEDEADWEIDPILLDNTIYNANYLELPPDDPRLQDDHVDAGDDDHAGAPNVVLRDFCSQANHSRHAASDTPASLGCNRLSVSKPIFERNRCTITITSGDWVAAQGRRMRPKRYVVASDGSEEAAYAAEWTIGTVLRDGDEILVVNVMETDVKFDELDRKNDTAAARTQHQKIRADEARILVAQCTRLLERTRLSVKVVTQALHAKNARHMLLDLIDFFEPTMVIVGSRGLSSLKGILLGSTSHYLVQKSSVPVMVVRKRLTLPPLPKAKADVVAEVKSRHRELRDAAIEKESNTTDENPELVEVEEQEIKDAALKDKKPPDNTSGPRIPHVPGVGNKKASVAAEERANAEVDKVREKEAQRELEREKQRFVAQSAEEERERVRLEQAERAVKRARAAGRADAQSISVKDAEDTVLKDAEHAEGTRPLRSGSLSSPLVDESPSLTWSQIPAQPILAPAQTPDAASAETFASGKKTDAAAPAAQAVVSPSAAKKAEDAA